MNGVSYLEGRAGNVLVSVLDGDVILSGLKRDVLNGTRTITVVLTRHLGL